MASDQGILPSVWPTHTVASMIERGWLEINDGYRVKLSELGAEGIPFVRGGDIGDGTISTSVKDHVLPEHHSKLTSKLTRAGDVAFITKGTVGRAGFLRDWQPTVVFAPQVCFWRSKDPNSLESRYIFYLICSRWFQAHLHGVMTSGSMAADYVSLRDQQHFRLPIPPPHFQRRISAVLGALDDKIELNRKMNCTLEQMAQAIFKSWFIDFDGHDPADMVESELGLIPIGWRAATLGDLAELNPESWGRSTRPAVLDYVDLGNTKWGRIESTTIYASDDAPSRAQRVLRPGDTIVGTVRPGNGAYALILDPGLTGSTGFAVLRPRRHAYTAFVYLAATAGDNIARLAHLADGGAYPAVRPDLVAASAVVRADDGTLERFASCVDPLLARIALAQAESRTLTTLRDTLLPKLISGEIRVPDAEATIAAAT